MKNVVLALTAICLATTAPVCSFAQAASAPAVKASPEIDAILTPIFDGMVKGNYRPALMSAFDRSALWKQKVAERENLFNQIDGALKIYGPVLSYELAVTKQRGSVWEHRVYVVQHRDIVTRWQFWMARTGGGWNIGYLGFDDQVQNWFAN